MRILSNGNIELTVQLMPQAYAALTATTARDDVTLVDAVNAAIILFDRLSGTADAQGINLGEMTRDG